MKEGHGLFLIVVGGIVLLLIVVGIDSYNLDKESDELHLKNCDELKAFILSEEDPSQHALNHWTVCTAGGWK